MARPAAATAIEVAGVMEDAKEEDVEDDEENARRVVDVKKVEDGRRFAVTEVNRAAVCLPCAARRSACRDAAMVVFIRGYPRC